MALSEYDKNLLSAENQNKLNEYTQAWERANAAGDVAGMNAAHDAAEAVRATMNYSGGEEGSGYTQLQKPLAEGELPTYQAQIEPINNLYGAADELVRAQLQTAYDNNRAELEAEKEKVPGLYNEQRNNAAIQSELEKQRFNEYAAANGINTGTNSQVELARSNALLGNINALNKGQADAIANLDLELAKLTKEYQNAITEALAKNQYEKAMALLAERQKEAESIVNVAQAQASLDLQRAAFNAKNGGRSGGGGRSSTPVVEEVEESVTDYITGGGRNYSQSLADGWYATANNRQNFTSGEIKQNADTLNRLAETGRISYGQASEILSIMESKNIGNDAYSGKPIKNLPTTAVINTTK